MAGDYSATCVGRQCHKPLRLGTNGAATSSTNMEYSGIHYTITRETHSGFWHWRTIVGTPPTVRAGEEATHIQAEYKVKAVIDWWLSQKLAENSGG